MPKLMSEEESEKMDHESMEETEEKVEEMEEKEMMEEEEMMEPEKKKGFWAKIKSFFGMN